MTIPSIYAPAVEAWMRRNGYMASRPATALIDMDGTLYDSMPAHSRAWEQMAREAGIGFEPGEFLMHEGRTGSATIDLLMRRERGRDATPGERESLYRRKTEIFAATPPPPPVAGAARMLGVLMAEGLKRVLVTGSGQSSLIGRLDHDFPGAFAPGMRVTSRDVTLGKPHPEPFERGMALARSRPCDTIVIENAPLGVEAGRKSGALTLAANTGNLPVGALEEAGADMVFPSMEALADALPGVLRAMRSCRLTE